MLVRYELFEEKNYFLPDFTIGGERAEKTEKIKTRKSRRLSKIGRAEDIGRMFRTKGNGRKRITRNSLAMRDN